MLAIDTALLIVSSFFAIYGCFAAIEAAIGLAALQPKIISVESDYSVKKFFTPLWEVTNVFLVFGFTALAVLFNNALKTLAPSVLPLIALAMLALLVRACVVLYIFYWSNSSLLKKSWLWVIFSLTTWLVPICFAAAGIYLLTGHQFWVNPLGWCLLVSNFLGLMAVGLVLIGQRTSLNLIAFASWLLAIGVWLPLQINHSQPRLINNASATLFGLITLLAILVLVTHTWRFNRRLLKLSAVAISIATPILMAWANRPFLIANRLSLKDAFGAQAFLNIFLVGLVLILPLLLVGFYLLYKLLVAPKYEN